MSVAAFTDLFGFSKQEFPFYDEDTFRDLLQYRFEREPILDRKPSAYESICYPSNRGLEFAYIPKSYYPVIVAFLRGYKQLHEETIANPDKPRLKPDCAFFLRNLFDEFFREAPSEVVTGEEYPYSPPLCLISYLMVMGYAPSAHMDWNALLQECVTYGFLLAPGSESGPYPNPCQFREL